jgi:hypothetical protein
VSERHTVAFSACRTLRRSEARRSRDSSLAKARSKAVYRSSAAASALIAGPRKQIVVQRAKQSGMHWTVKGAADIIALRCQHASGRWDDFVAPRRATAAGLRAVI